MSGGFFRGTSAEQDTRFSNKQAKLLKTQKFPAELDHMVDITKVKMDVMNPWIAKRVTELLGFEDEVLINFINGLLEGKDINGKQIQIQLTGFMEKHTGKFMKELWSLLLSAQNNASGVPQQFLDAKEEETRKKKEELDRIGIEMQKRKEKEDGGVNDYSAAGPNSKFVPAKDSDIHSDDEKEAGIKSGFRRSSRSSRSPQPANRPSSPHRATSRAASKSYLNSRSYSGERNRSRNLSRSPLSRRDSISPERRRYRSLQRSTSPVPRRTSDESLSPRRRSPRLRRSMSRSRNRSVSPARRQNVRSPSPGRRRSRSPLWHRSRSPKRPWRRHRSPSRRRRPSPSLSPRRRQSPPPRRHRSRSPHRRHLSPSPRRRSISPRRYLSPSPVRRHRRRSPSSSPSPVRNKPSSAPRNGSAPAKRRLSSKHSSPSPSRDSSPSPSRARSLSPVGGSPSLKKRVPVLSSLRAHNQQDGSSSPQTQPSLSPVRRTSSSPSRGDLTMLKKDLRQSPTDRSWSHDQSSPRYHHTLKERYGTPDVAHKGPDSTRDMSSKSLHLKDHNRSENREEKSYKRKSSPRSVSSPKEENVGTHDNSSGERRYDDNKLRKKEIDIRREKTLTKESTSLRNITDGISSPLQEPAVLSPIDERKEDEELLKLMKKDIMKCQTPDSTDSEGKNTTNVTKKRKHRKSSRREIGSGSSGEDSEIEDRKESKRRRKEEKKSRKDEKRRRREERRRRKEEKRAQKRRSKDSDSMSSGSDKHENDVNASGGNWVAGKTYSPESAEAESEKKRVENELREKALQNIRAKKGISR